MTDGNETTPTAGRSAVAEGWRDRVVALSGPQRVIFALVLFAAIFYASFVISTATSPLLDMHSFRQTQTAISVDYMLREGRIFNYLTPVVGTPWSIPFEAPIYHVTVAAVAKVLPIPLDAAGRLVSAAYYVGALIYGVLIIRRLQPRRASVVGLFLLLSLAAPIYLFWSRTFLIETTALFFGAMFYYHSIRFLDTKGLPHGLLLVIGSLLCGLSKATTWPVFVAAIGIHFISLRTGTVLAILRERRLLRNAKLLLGEGALLGGTVIATYFAVSAWNHHADELKSLSIIGARLTSDSLTAWNFGTWGQRWSSDLWVDVIWSRALPEALGGLWAVPVAAIIMRFGRAKTIAISGVALFLYLLPFVLFTNLQSVHSYYQAANSIFLIAAAAIVLGNLVDREAASRIARWSALGIAVAVAAFQYRVFFDEDGYFEKAAKDSTGWQHYRAALLTNQMVPNTHAVIAFGYDWSSVYNYYAGRKGVAFPRWSDAELLRSFISSPTSFLGELPLGAVSDCKRALPFASEEATRAADEVVGAVLKGGLGGEWTQEKVGACMVYIRVLGQDLER